MTKADDSLSISRVHIWVGGRVQGVGFRAFVQQQALFAGLTGWVRNVGYDQVEVVAQGPRPALEQFVEIVRRGPRASRVDNSRVEWEAADEKFATFSIRI